MSDSFTETTSESWFSRIKASIGGMFFGIVMVAISFPVLFFNEGRAVKTAQSLKEGSKAVLSVQASPLKDSNTGKLVHFTGMTATTAALRDAVFGVEAKALQLSRKVEMYQWKQTSRSTSKEKLGGGKETVTTYDYEKEWSAQLQSSKGFKNPAGHENPTALPYSDEKLVAADVTVGDYLVPQRIVAGLDGSSTKLMLDEKALVTAPNGVSAAVATPTPAGTPSVVGTPAPAATPLDSTPAAAMKPKLDQGGIYYGASPGSPQVGDIRVSFTTMGLTEISVIGRQVGKTIEPYQTKAGRSLEMARAGTHSADAMFAGAMKSNSIMTWALRVLGFILMFIGSSMVFKPLVMIGKFVPMIGSIIGAGTGLLALGLSSVGSLATIAVAWFVYRPLLAIVLLVIGAAIGGFVLMRGKAKTVASATPGGPAISKGTI